MNSSELQFILKMRDEASAVLKQHGAALKEAGGHASDLKRHGSEGAASLGELGKAAKEATEAIVALWASNEMVKGALESYQETAEAMNVIGRAANATKAQVAEMKEELEKLGTTSGTASAKSIGDIAVAAAKLGYSTQEIPKFADAFSDLSVKAGASAATLVKEFAHIVKATGESTSSYQQFIDTVAALEKNSSSSISQIMRMTATMAEMTAQFNIGSRQLAAWATAADELGQRPQRFAMSFSMALTQIKTAAEAGGKAIEVLGERTGMADSEIQRLMREDPSKVFMKILEIVQKMKAQGNDATPFLAQMGVQGAQAVREVEIIASRLDLVKEKMNIALGDNAGAAAKRAQDILIEYGKAVERAGNAWDVFKDQFGTALAPLATGIMNGITNGLTLLGDAFEKLGSTGSQFVAWGTVVGTALIGVRAALALFGEVLAPLVGIVTGSLGMIATAFRVVFLDQIIPIIVGFTQGVVGELIVAFGAIPLAIAAAVALVGVAVYEIWQHWEAVKKFFSQPIGDIVRQAWDGLKTAVVETLSWVYNWAKSAWDRVLGIFSAPVKGPGEKGHGEHGAHGETGQAAAGEHGANGPAAGPQSAANDNNVNGAGALNQHMQQAIAGLEKFRNEREKLILQEKALNELVVKNSSLIKADQRTADEIASAQQLFAIAKRKSDAAGEEVYQLGLQAQKAGAVTQADKEQVQLQETLNKLYEAGVVLTGEEGRKRVEAVAAAMKQLQDAQRQASFQQDALAFKQQVDMARALTQVEKDRLAVEQQIENLRRSKNYDQGQLDFLKRQLELEKEIARFAQQMDALNPQAKGIRDYNEQLQTLEQRLRRGLITQQEYNRERTKLFYDTQKDRDPLGAMVQSQKEEIAQLVVQGEYRDADRKSLQQIVELQKQGVNVTREAAQAMGEYNRYMQDAQKAQSSGFTGWANGIGTMKDNLMDLQKDFASGLSSAISGAIKGQKGVVSQLLSNISGKLIDMGVTQLMKQAMGSMGLLDGGQAELAKAAGAALKLGGEAGKQVADTASEATRMADALKSMTTAQMTVTAGVVNVSGAGVPGVGGNGLPGAGGSPGATDVNIAGVGGSSLTTPSIPFSMPGTNPISSASTSLSQAGLAPLGMLGAGAFGLGGFKPQGSSSIGNIGGMGFGQFPLAANSNSPFGDLSGAMKAFGPKELGPLGNPFGKGVGSLGTNPGIGGFGMNAFGKASPMGKTLELSSKDITDLKKTLMTEWVPGAGEAQGKGIIDTILNRQASGHWGSSVKDVVDARKQFSDINGPVAWKRGRSSVDDLPDSDLLKGRGARSSDLVDRYLQERAGGAKSIVGDHLNYANPKYSDLRNREWIDKLDGPKLGAGNATHWHGTTDGLNKFRPGEFGVKLPGQDELKQMQLQASQSMKQMQTTVSQDFKQMGSSVTQVGQEVQTITPRFQNLGTNLTKMGTDVSQVVPGLGGMTGGLQNMMGPLTQGPGAANSFSSSLQQLISQMSSGMGGGGGFGGLFSMFGGMHSGGIVGPGGYSTSHFVSPSVFTHARRLHTGLKDDEYPTILQKGERVLTANDNVRNNQLIRGMTDSMENMHRAMGNRAQSDIGGRQVNQNMNITVNTPNADSFRKSKSQIMADMGVHMNRAAGS